MIGDGSLGYWSQDTNHSFSHHCNGVGIYNDESLEFLRLMEGVDMGLLRPYTLPIVILEFIVVTNMVEVDIVLKRPANLPLKIMNFIIVVIKVVMMVEVDIYLKRPTTLPLAIMEQELMLVVEMDIGHIPATIPPITQVSVVYFWVSHFILVLLTKMVMNMR